GQLGFAALALWFALGIVGSWVLHVGRESAGMGGWLGRWAPNLGFVAAYAWAAFEPLRYHALLRRRAAMGIGDPLVANRMLLWGVGRLASGCVAGVHLVAQLLGAYELPESLVGVVSLLVLVTAAAEWLAFFPPRAYLRRFGASAPTASR